MKLFIKNMVCNRCKMVVRSELEKIGVQAVSVELGEVETLADLSQQQTEQFKKRLESLGFELIDDKKSRIIEKIKSAIIELIQSNNADTPKINYSNYIESS